MGGPSAAIVIAELVELGARDAAARRHLRRRSTGPLALGQLLVVAEAIAEDGTSRALGAGERVAPDPGCSARAATDGPATGRRAQAAAVVTTDLFYDPSPGPRQRWRDAGAAAVEMEAATLFALAARRGLRAAAVLIVSDLLSRSAGGSTPTRCATPSPARRRRGQRAGGERSAAAAGFSVGLRRGLRAASWRRAGRGRLPDALEPLQRRLDPGQPLVERRRRAAALEPLVEPVEPVLDPLQALRDAAHPAGEPLEVAGRGQVEGPHRHLLGAHRALARLERARQRAATTGFSSSSWASLPIASSP